MEEFLAIYLPLYGLLAVAHILIQMAIGHMEHRHQKHPSFDKRHAGHTPSVSVVIPAYNESPKVLLECIESVLRQDYSGDVEVFVIDDGSTNQSSLIPLYNELKGKGIKVILNERNMGKRESQKRAFDLATGEIIVTIDSDTIINKDGIRHMVRRFKNPEVGAVTGDVKVENRKTNLLTRLIGYRYWTAFHQERAAQSRFGVLMCCSGPFSAYRGSVVKKLKNKYVSQQFLGQKCTFGDDRHLTNLVLEDGWKVYFDSKAVAYTHVPENLRSYLKQQVRWNKSFYREMLWTIRYAHKHHWYLLTDLILQFILPFMLLTALGAMIYQAVTVDIAHLYKYAILLILIAFLRSLYGITRTRDFGFLTFIIYGFVHVFLLIPTRFYALFTIGNVKWGTR